MASSSYSTLSWCSPPIPKPSSKTPFSSSLLPLNTRGFSGISLHKSVSSSRVHAKFDKFQGQENLEQELIESAPLDPQLQTIEEDEEEDDSCLPSDLEGAVQQSGQATASFVSSGGMRAIVELLIPQLQFLDDEGAQSELWELSRIFVETLIEETGCQRVKAIFPDAGAAALLKYRWKDATFEFASLGDRKPVSREDEIVVMVVPDYQMLEYVERIASDLSDDPWRRPTQERRAPVTNNRLILQMVVGLTDAYSGVETLIRQSNPLPPFYQARSMLILERAGFVKRIVTVSNSAIVTAPSDDNSSQFESLPPNRGQKGQNGNNRGKNRGGGRGGGKGGGHRRGGGGGGLQQHSGQWGSGPASWAWQWPRAMPPCPFPSGNWARPMLRPSGQQQPNNQEFLGHCRTSGSRPTRQ